MTNRAMFEIWQEENEREGLEGGGHRAGGQKMKHILTRFKPWIQFIFWI